ncbi:transcriptional regulator ATRX-like [Diprion similis]|uniref:transcriptional regulator ATRX-like n=1 Tax=Diprion similis TaxID=362088 RepID=UPI001EF873F9|nr:transcriptional regulator ATRX-like [Diprion similis]
MTTIDSDSESQDSDDGRRFRFEATRKDDMLRLHSQNKRRSPISKGSKYRSRSMERISHNRRDAGKMKQDRDRKEANDRDRRKNSKDRDSLRDNKHDKSNNKDSRHNSKGNIKELPDSKTLVEGEKRCSDSKNSNYRDSKDSVRNSSNSKDHRNVKDSRSRELKNTSIRAPKDTRAKETKEPKDQDEKNFRDHLRDRGRVPKRSRDASHERLMTAKHGHRSREKHNSRDRSNNRDKTKPMDDEKIKTKNPPRKQCSKEASERKSLKRDTHSPSKILEQIGSDSESDLGALDPDVGPVMALDALEDCREMNLSDFDIISDTEGTSLDSSDAKSPTVKGPIIRGEILAPHYYGPKIKKRVSRRQYERLVKKQAALNTHRLEDIYKVNPRNDNITPLAPSNNNPSAVSDFLLGPEASVSAVRDLRGSHKREDENSKDWSKEQDLEEDVYKLEEKGEQDLRKVNCLKLDKLSLTSSNNKEKSSRRNESLSINKGDEDHRGQIVDSEIYGPVLPPKCLKDLPSHPKTRSGEVDKVVRKPNVFREVAAPCHKAEHGSSPNEMSQSLSAKSYSTEIKSDSENCDDFLPKDSCSPVTFGKNTNEPRDAIIGPSLPPAFRLNSESPKSRSQTTYDPSLLNHSAKVKEEIKQTEAIGPSLPPGFQRDYALNSTTSSDENSASHQHPTISLRSSVFGPTLPPYLMKKVIDHSVEKSGSDSEDDVLGPMPSDHPAAIDSYIQRQLEDRARRMKSKLDGEDSIVEKREEWMLELPSVQAANLGLGKRQFRNKAGPDMSDRSSWTDTPADKARKKEEKVLGKSKVADPARESEKLAIQQRDKAMEEMAKKHASKKRKESLLEIHKKKLHKKKKKEEKQAKEAEKPTRRPFDRDIDLQANRFDEAQKKSILKKAQLLNDRFSRGESKYL